MHTNTDGTTAALLYPLCNVLCKDNKNTICKTEKYLQTTLQPNFSNSYCKGPVIMEKYADVLIQDYTHNGMYPVLILNFHQSQLKICCAKISTHTLLPQSTISCVMICRRIYPRFYIYNKILQNWVFKEYMWCQ